MSNVTQSQQPLKGRIREAFKETKRKYSPVAKEKGRAFLFGLRRLVDEEIKKSKRRPRRRKTKTHRRTKKHRKQKTRSKKRRHRRY